MSLTVDWVKSSVGKSFIKEHHYSRTCHNGPMTVGLFEEGELVGVLAFATPSSENVRASVWGADYKDSVTELHRLVVLDRMPKNTESWFIVRALRLLKERKPHINGVLSFADTTEGHVGTIYQATNALYCGETKGRTRFWRDPEGRLRHPRQSGVNISATEAAKRGWVAEYRGQKHRYLFLLPNSRAHRKELIRRLKLPTYPYPRKGEAL
jgi:hypothetical protein